MRAKQVHEKDLWLYFACGCSFHWEPVHTCYCQPLHWQIPQLVYGWIPDKLCPTHDEIQWGMPVSKAKQLKEVD